MSNRPHGTQRPTFWQPAADTDQEKNVMDASGQNEEPDEVAQTSEHDNTWVPRW